MEQNTKWLPYCKNKTLWPNETISLFYIKYKMSLKCPLSLVFVFHQKHTLHLSDPKSSIQPHYESNKIIHYVHL